ncbi:MAG: RNA pyrophosphohydrolase [Marinicaulis sp.]|nr:RNA pyrophosphohydrolase [Marinicaulis sp.]NNE40671.1 RNA pyrophosphohydrolase [Marinicaulis sp.]NNL88162.1 RNA pyrophosphohydrolase [Marinicaulis sp.]
MRRKDLDKYYRPNVGIVLFNKKGEVWFGRRISDFVDDADKAPPFCWQMPQGGVDKGEGIIDAAYRELKEETGVTSARLLALSTGWLAYDFPREYKKKKWRGQRQKWAAMLFEGDDAEIRIDNDDHQEFDAWRWGALEDAPPLIVPFKRSVYEELVAAFRPLRDYIRDAI